MYWTMLIFRHKGFACAGARFTSLRGGAKRHVFVGVVLGLTLGVFLPSATCSYAADPEAIRKAYVAEKNPAKRAQHKAALLAHAQAVKDRRAVTEFLAEQDVALNLGQAQALAFLPPRDAQDYRTGPWLAGYFAHMPGGGYHHRFCEQLVPLLNSEEVSRLFAALAQAMERTRDPKQWSAIMNWAVLAARLKGDSGSLLALLQANEDPLQEAVPQSLAVWRIRAYIVEGNKEVANAELARAVEAHPALKNSTTYRGLEDEIFMLSVDEQGPAVEARDLEAIRGKYAGAQSHGRTNEMHRLIRDTLLDKSDATVGDPETPRLFRGAKGVFRDFFGVVDTYAAYTKDHAAALVARGGYTEAEAARYRRRMALTAPPPGDALPSTGLRWADIAVADGTTNVLDLLDIPQGVLELRGRHTQFNLGGGDPESFCRPQADGNELFVFTSLGMACLRAGSVAWTRGMPCVTVWDHARVPTYLGGARVCATTENLVVSRVATDSGTALRALRRRDGEPVWTYVPRGAVISSDPALWRDRICVQGRRTGHGGGTTLLILLDAETGRETGRFQIASEPKPAVLTHKQYQGDRWHYHHTYIDYAHNMPAPAIAGDVAFLQPNSGVAAAFHLADESISWLRVLARETSRSPAVCRTATAPALGRTNLLLAPPESRHLLLLNRSTGRQVAMDTTTQWTDLCAAGEQSAAVLTREQVQFHALEDLRLIAKHALPGTRVLQSLDDGCMLYDDRRIYVFSAAGKLVREMPLPPHVQPARCDGRAVYGFRRDRPDRLVVLSAKPATPTAEVPVVSAPLLGRHNTLSGGALVLARTPRGVLLNHRDMLTFMTERNQRVWSLPVVRHTPVWPLGRVFGVAQLGRIDFYDVETGQWQRRWPPFTPDNALSTREVLKSGERLFARTIERHGASTRAMCYRVTDEGRRGEPVAQSPPTWKVMAGDGDFFFNYWPNYWVYAFGLSSRDAPPAKRHYPLKAKYRIDGETFILIPDAASGTTWVPQRVGRTVRRFDDDGVSEAMPIAGQGHLWDIENPPGVQQGVLSFLHGARGNRQWLFWDSATRRQAVLASCDRSDRRTWVQTDKRIHTLENGPDGTIRACVLDFGGKGEPQLTRGDFVKRPAGRLDIPMQIGSTLVYPFYQWTWPAFHRPSYSSMVALQKIGETKLEVRPFPHFAQTRALGGGLGMFNDTVVDERMLNLCLDMEKSVRRTPLRSDPPTHIDGFLDEWDAKEFVSTAHGRMAVRLRHERTVHWQGNGVDTHWIAIEIADPALVALLAREGADNHLDVLLANGSKAGFFQDSEGERKSWHNGNASRNYWDDVHSLVWRKRMSVGGPATERLAYSVSPDGRRAQIELAINGKRVRRARKAGDQPWATEIYYGDVAVRVLWRRALWDAPVNLLANATSGPLSFTRIVLQ
jgi:hypothetical protein